MRVAALFSAILIASPLQTASLAAQSAADLDTQEQRLARALQAQDAGAVQSPPTLKGRMLSAVGGAVIGAGLGFFASQLATGDWEREAQTGAVDRPTWAAVGGSIGLALGFSFPLGSRGTPSLAQPLPSLQRSAIVREELERLGSTHAYEAVEVLRPEWLHDRGPNEWGDTPADGMNVYVDGTRVGNLSELRQFSTNDLEAIRFIEASTATARWGTGNSRGALLLILRGA